MVAYQTAYLKANYPVEFMAALLTSEMDKTEKIVQYMEESRTMGLRVAPPDVNRSRAQFTVSGEAIHFGLGAIKNVGSSAIDSIVQERQQRGPFTSLEDFCARVDLRLVNRRVLEGLIKAGAFDSLGQSRAGLLSGLDQALEAGQRRQRDREEGQGSLFEALVDVSGAPAASGMRAPAAAVPEWPPEELLAYEKDVLGFYLSGHPLEQYRDVGRRLGAATAAELYARPVGARVILLGQLSAVTENSTKSGNRMAFATLDLVDGSVPLTIFPEPYRSCGATLKQRGPVLVRGRADDSDKGRVVLAEEIRPLEEALGAVNGEGNGGEALACRIRLQANGDGMEASLRAAKAICHEHQGRTPLFLHVMLPEREVVIRVKELSVAPDRAMTGKLEALLGPGSVLVEYAGRA
jgi:DNA polymerase-3 subunit alpha